MPREEGSAMSRLDELTPRERSFRATFLLAQAQILIDDPEAFEHWRRAARTDLIFRACLEQWQQWLQELCQAPFREEPEP